MSCRMPHWIDAAFNEFGIANSVKRENDKFLIKKMKGHGIQFYHCKVRGLYATTLKFMGVL